MTTVQTQEQMCRKNCKPTKHSRKLLTKEKAKSQKENVYTNKKKKRKSKMNTQGKKLCKINVHTWNLCRTPMLLPKL